MMPLLAELGGSLHVGLAAVGSAIGVGIIGMKAAEATGRNPGAAGAIRNQAIIFAALAEGGCKAPRSHCLLICRYEFIAHRRGGSGKPGDSNR
jgi:F-type H+-transporting ATPase subunit c